MYSFKNGYDTWCHPSILTALKDNNLTQQEWYGNDEYTKKAQEVLKKHINSSEAFIRFVSWGTQVNLIVISAMLKPYESVISAQTGHINVHEAGAIESVGHKINMVHSENWKVTPEDVIKVIEEHALVPHMVKPKAVYISNSTEVGTVYTKQELIALYSLCKELWLYLFLDWARIGSALCSDQDITLEDVYKYTDVFYIGGTKNGALFGEAIVINNPEIVEDFDIYLKQKWALLAKSRVLGIQFYELFRENLFFELAQHSNDMSKILVQWIKKLHYDFSWEPVSNQIFPIFPRNIISKLQEKYEFYVREDIDKKNSVVRLITSWSTTEEMVNRFISDLSMLS